MAKTIHFGEFEKFAQDLRRRRAGGAEHTFSDVEKRTRILDQVDKMNGGPLTLQDADHAECKRIIETFSGFALATKEIQTMC